MKKIMSDSVDDTYLLVLFIQDHLQHKLIHTHL